MLLLTDADLTHHTKPELWELYREMRAALTNLPHGSIERDYAVMNLRHILRFIGRLADFAFTP